MPPHEPSAFPKNLPDPKLLPAVEIDEILTSIQHSHSYYYKVMNLEVWALVETLDGMFPGAWGQFMTNRQVAVKQFLERDRHPTNCRVDAGGAREKEEGRRPFDSAEGKKKEEARSQESGVRKQQEEE
ncbi:hypothetical protein [Microcoleus vaginatus]|jgi:hypothetical protein|uniref:hypothetical protein n=1 Tax=Microcoleus vaginatus TaxID=119532 RepID=UPI001685FAD9|nr:hypothetical protein [Microcoleus sp. FACHB-84]MBD2011299.1 hypothetical protein [Microcoleus sp. FACHB-45]